jgi:hypothetical protein
VARKTSAPYVLDDVVADGSASADFDRVHAEDRIAGWEHRLEVALAGDEHLAARPVERNVLEQVPRLARRRCDLDVDAIGLRKIPRSAKTSRSTSAVNRALFLAARWGVGPTSVTRIRMPAAESLSRCAWEITKGSLSRRAPTSLARRSFIAAQASHEKTCSSNIDTSDSEGSPAHNATRLS